MSDAQWDDLERLWQSLPAHAAPAVEELKRQARWQWLSRISLLGEVAIAFAGVLAGVWMITRGDSAMTIMGIATLAFVAAVSVASIWARSMSPVRADDPVLRAVETAVRRARLGVRLGLATLWSVCAALVFLAIAAFAFDTDAGPHTSGNVAIGVALIWLAAWLSGTIVYLRRRWGDLARLEALRAGLMSESGVR